MCFCQTLKLNTQNTHYKLCNLSTTKKCIYKTATTRFLTTSSKLLATSAAKRNAPNGNKWSILSGRQLVKFTPKILSYMTRIVNYFYQALKTSREILYFCPTFAKGSHTAHQVDLISSGLDNFLVLEKSIVETRLIVPIIPYSNQLDAVLSVLNVLPNWKYLKKWRLSTGNKAQVIHSSSQCIDQSKQPCHTLEAVKLMEHGIKQIILVSKIKFRWVYLIPLYQPSWELEIYYKTTWLEQSGAQNSNWLCFWFGSRTFGHGLFDIPDIRLFLSNDSGFLSQFIRSVAGDVVEQWIKFKHRKKSLTSVVFPLVYRHMERTLTQSRS
ncbi:mitochondrial, Probable phenylalanine--tRNA ligase [Lucilia cuprina]|nr:mitochondrial, Probable phenylalanine--tRNA ligase [Lucilia cuprina]